MLTNPTPQEWADEMDRQAALKRPFGTTPAKAAGLSFGSKAAYAMGKLKKAGKS